MLFAFPIFGALILLPLIGLVLGILTAVDVSKYPEWAFGSTGASKTVWQVLPVVLGLFCLGIGGIVMYFIWTGSRRAEVARVAQSGPPPAYGYGYGAPTPPGYPPPPAQGWTPPQAPPPPASPPPPAPPPQAPQ